MQKVFAYIRKYRMIRENEKILAGVSGGADSLCLLFLLQSYRKILPFSLTAVHVEHGIRGEESRKDAQFVQTVCEREGIPCICVSRPVPALAREKKLSLEEAARLARYEAFEKIRRENGYDKIAVAHNQNDQAETMLFRMARGCGVKGAGGMRPVRGAIIRPLLCVSRPEIEQYLLERGAVWREDSTNACTAYSRNLLRCQVFPLLEKSINKKTAEHFCALAKELQDMYDVLEEKADETLGGLASFSPEGAYLSVGALLKERESMQEFCLQRALERAGCSLKDVSRDHIQKIRALLAAQSGKSVDLPGNWRAIRQFDRLALLKEDRTGGADFTGFCVEIAGPGLYETPSGTFACRIFDAENQKFLRKTYTKWFDCDKINDRLFLRTARPGDFLVIDDRGGTKKLNRYLMEQKVPREKRGSVLLLASGSETLWAVGYRIGERCKITKDTKKILEVRRIGENDGGENQYLDIGGRSRRKDQGNGGEDQPGL